MSMPGRFLNLFRRGKLEADMSEEMRHHVELQTGMNLKAGMNAGDARDAALRQFGNVASIQERAREARGWLWLEQGVGAFRVAGRRLKRSPQFVGTVVLVLGLCVGGNLAIFAWVDSVLLRPLPFPDAERLALIFNTYPQAGVLRGGSSVTNYHERRGRLPAFAGIALYRPSPAIVGEPDASQREAVMQVSAEFFDVLGRGPALGRAFTEAETVFPGGKVVILSDAYWRQYFNGDPQVVGRQLRVNGSPRTIVGVLPADFRFLSFAPQLYLPASSPPGENAPANRHSGGNVTQLIARLNPGVEWREAQAQIDAHNAALEQGGPDAARMRAAGFRSLVVSLHDDHVAGIRPTLWLMQGGGFFLLLVGATNLANLLLLRATERRKDLAIRQALGAGRRNVVTEVMAETGLLTLAGGGFGLALGAAGIRMSAAFGADRLPLGTGVALDGRLALLTVGGVIAVGFVVGLVVAGLVLRSDPREALQAGAYGATVSKGLRRLRQGFVVFQLALAFVLVAAAGQLVLSLRKSMAVSPGFLPENVLTGKIWISPASSPDASRYVGVTERIVDEISRQPGVAAAGLATNLPFNGLNGKSAVTVKDWTLPAGESPRGHYAYNVTGGYFAALAVELRTGRFLTEDDSRRRERACVVDEDFAAHYWPGAPAVGHVLFEGSQAGKDQEGYTVVGVVGRVKHANLTDPEKPGAVYFPLGHRPDRDVYLVVRTGQAQGLAAETVREVIKHVDSKLSLGEVRTMQSRVDDSLIARRSPALLGMLFAGVALLLAVVGTYGLLSYAVTQRYREIGIRVALGARPEQIMRQFLSLSGRLLGVAVILGSAGIAVVGRGLQVILFELPAFPVDIWGLTVAAVVGVVMLTCLIPARRAARVDPVVALRAE